MSVDAKPLARSAYILELSVVPGGARRGDVHVYGSFEPILRCLEEEFLTPDQDMREMSAYLAIFYGETILLWIVRNGEAVQAIDLHPFISARIGDAPAETLDRLDREHPFAQALEDMEEPTGVTLTIDWEALTRATPALEGTVLRPGEVLALSPMHERPKMPGGLKTYMELTDNLPYGYSDLEN